MISDRRFARGEHASKPHIFWDAHRGIWTCTGKNAPPLCYREARFFTYRLNAYKGPKNRMARFMTAWRRQV